MTTFTLPDLGEGLTGAEVVTWRVSVGDEVEVDQVLADVETAKATVELPCPFAGRISELHAAPGDTVAVGAPLVTVVDRTDETRVNVPPQAASAAPESGAVLVGFGTRAAPPSRRANGRTPRDAPRVISPVVRKLAHDRSVDLTALAGSGPAGVILRRDVEAAAPTPPPTLAGPTTGTRIRLQGAARLAADRFTRSRREIPEATTWVDVDATELVAAREALRSSATSTSEAPRIGLMALLSRFVVAGLARFPELNASIEAEGDDLVVVRHDHVHLGFAAQTDRGLVVPVVRDADGRSTAELAAELHRLTEKARAGALTPRELTGGTFTLNNYGVFGVDGSTPIINHPEVALLGIGRVADKPWVVDGTLAVRKVTQLSLTFDHRVCDGGVAGGFLRYVADCVQNPVGLLADL